MITAMIEQYFAKLAADLAPKLKQVQTRELDWQDVYSVIYDSHSDLIAAMRRNYESLNIGELVNPTDLEPSNLGLLSASIDEQGLPARQIEFPSAPQQQSSPPAVPRISG